MRLGSDCDCISTQDTVVIVEFSETPNKPSLDQVKIKFLQLFDVCRRHGNVHVVVAIMLSTCTQVSC